MARDPVCFMLVVLTLIGFASANHKVSYKVECGDVGIKVALAKTDDITDVYIDRLKDYPDCAPQNDGSWTSVFLPYSDFSRCGTTQVVNKKNDQVTFYNKIVIKFGKAKEVILVKCNQGSNSTYTWKDAVRIKRDVLPIGFQEDDEEIEITQEFVGEAAVPILNMAVMQDGRAIDSQLNVRPGTPLNMKVFLDEKSQPVYGLLTKQMFVSNTKRQEEVIINDGCSVDTYLFENFNTVDGDVLTAKFRAFKFPETNYVLFKGIITVCINKCPGMLCGNGQLGYGRRKRDTTNTENVDSSSLYEVTMTTFIKVSYAAGIPLGKGSVRGFHETSLEGVSPPQPLLEVLDDGASFMQLSSAVILVALIQRLIF